MATHSSILAWRIPGTGEPDELPSLRSHRVGHDGSDLAAAAAASVLAWRIPWTEKPGWNWLNPLWMSSLGTAVAPEENISARGSLSESRLGKTKQNNL